MNQPSNAPTNERLRKELSYILWGFVGLLMLIQMIVAKMEAYEWKQRYHQLSRTALTCQQALNACNR